MLRSLRVPALRQGHVGLVEAGQPSGPHIPETRALDRRTREIAGRFGDAAEPPAGEAAVVQRARVPQFVSRLGAQPGRAFEHVQCQFRCAGAQFAQATGHQHAELGLRGPACARGGQPLGVGGAAGVVVLAPHEERPHRVGDLPGHGGQSGAQRGPLDGQQIGPLGFHPGQGLRLRPRKVLRNHRAGPVVTGERPVMGVEDLLHGGGRGQVGVPYAASRQGTFLRGLLVLRPFERVQAHQVVEPVPALGALRQQMRVVQHVERLRRGAGAPGATERGDRGRSREFRSRVQREEPVEPCGRSGEGSVGDVQGRAYVVISADPEGTQPVALRRQLPDHLPDGAARPGSQPRGGNPDGEREPRAQRHQVAGVRRFLGDAVVQQGGGQEFHGGVGVQRVQFEQPAAVQQESGEPPAAGHRDHAPAARQQGPDLGRSDGIVEQEHHPPVGRQGAVQPGPFLRPGGDAVGRDAEAEEEPPEDLLGRRRAGGGLGTEVGVELPVGALGAHPVQPGGRENGLADAAEPCDHGPHGAPALRGERADAFQQGQLRGPADEPADGRKLPGPLRAAPRRIAEVDVPVHGSDLDRLPLDRPADVIAHAALSRPLHASPANGRPESISCAALNGDIPIRRGPCASCPDFGKITRPQCPRPGPRRGCDEADMTRRPNEAAERCGRGERCGRRDSNPHAREAHWDLNPA